MTLGAAAVPAILVMIWVHSVCVCEDLSAHCRVWQPPHCENNTFC